MPERNLPFFEMFAKYHPAPALAAQLETWLVTGAVILSLLAGSIEETLCRPARPGPAGPGGAGSVSDLRPAGGDLPPRLPPGSGRGGGAHASSTGRGGCPAASGVMCHVPHEAAVPPAWEAPAPAAEPAPVPEEPEGGLPPRKRTSPSRKTSSARPRLGGSRP